MKSNAREEVSTQELRKSPGLLTTRGLSPSLSSAPPCLVPGVVTCVLGNSVASRISPKERRGDIIWLEEKVR